MSVSGAVTDAKTGAKIGRFEVEWSQPDKPRPLPRGAIRTNTQLWGRYNITKTEPGEESTFVIKAQGYRDHVSRVFLASESFITYDVKLERLAPGEGGGPTGTVVDINGKVVSGVDVLMATTLEGATLMDGAAHPPEGYGSWSGVGYVTTGEDGTFTFSPIAGAYQLAAVHESGYAQVSSQDLKNSPRITLRPWGRIEGRVHPSVKLQPGDTAIVWSNDESTGFRERINSSYQNIKIDPDRRFKVERVTRGIESSRKHAFEASCAGEVYYGRGG
jgi:hypothetical protein